MKEDNDAKDLDFEEAFYPDDGDIASQYQQQWEEDYQERYRDFNSYD